MSAPVLKRIASNFHSVLWDGLELWFSYETCVGIRVGHGLPVVCQNQWGPTTGKHLNRIDGGTPHAKKMRQPYIAFDAHVSAVLAQFKPIGV